MPSASAMIWTAVCGGFAMMSVVIGVLIKMGFNGVRSDIQGLRGDINKYHDSEMETKGDLKAHMQKCEERHRLLEVRAHAH